MHTHALLSLDDTNQQWVAGINVFMSTAAARVWNEQVVAVIKRAVDVVIKFNIRITPVSTDTLQTVGRQQLLDAVVDCAQGVPALMELSSPL